MATGQTISVEICAKQFGGQPLFQGLRFDVPPGQVLALIGPSGVGKSTLLRLIAGLDRTFDGTITIGGLPAGQGPVPGFVFQDPRLLPWASALGNIRAVSAAITPAQARARLAEVGLSGHENALPQALSGGMQRRVALARALAVNPGLLLLDEPFVSLDRKLASELALLVAAVAGRNGSTVVLVSHDPEDAARLADRVIRLSGRPARIAEDRSLPTPRATRTPEVIRTLVRSMTEGSPA